MTDPRRDWPLAELEASRREREHIARVMSWLRAVRLYDALCRRYGLDPVETEVRGA